MLHLIVYRAKIVFLSQFSMSKINRIFQKRISSKNINLGDHFMLKSFFFLGSIFDPLYFLKLGTIFDDLTFIIGFFKNIFLVPMLIWPKILLLGPTIFEIPQPN